ncbi:MAG: hypothetical protein ACYS8L_06665 [Planctomycetota bacterium]|jgi:hypothetical protein
MADDFTVVLSAPDIDSVVAGALVGRALKGRVEALVFDSPGLLEFFSSAVQQKLPRSYSLVLCGVEVVHSDWHGRLVRPSLMDALRDFLGPIRWFSAGHWEPEDRRAVAHIVGPENLRISPSGGSVAVMVRSSFASGDDEYADSLLRLATDRLSEREEEEWGASARRVVTALKADYRQLAGAVGLLIESRIGELIEEHAATAQQTDEAIRDFARRHAGEPKVMGSMKMVVVSLQRAMQPFWAEIAAHARQEADAELSLCHLEGRPVMLLARGREVRTDLRAWARYVTDLLPGARSIGARPDVIPLLIPGLGEDVALRAEVLNLMADGAHLLRN